jgi:hypothetical protein
MDIKATLFQFWTILREHWINSLISLSAMVIRKELLLNLPAEMPKLERPHHSTRYNTLKQLAAFYASDPSYFLDAEICV